MAMTIDDLKTFEVEVAAPPLEKIVEKFAGRRTRKTIAAAQRVAAKKKKIKIPRNLLRALWRATGGWKEAGRLTLGWGNWPQGGVFPADTRRILIGDLRLYGVPNHDPNYQMMFFGYRHWRRVAHFPSNWGTWFIGNHATHLLQCGEDVGGQKISDV